MLPPDFDRRASGLLLHPTSLPGPYGVGDIGPEARRFADFLASAGQTLWQMLPVGPIGFGNSPYSAHSAFAGSPLLISLDDLLADGLLDKSDLEPAPRFSIERADYPSATFHHESRLRFAFARFGASAGKTGASSRDRGGLLAEHDAFVARAADWLEDFALYSSLKRRFDGKPWIDWPRELRDREPAALDKARAELGADMALVRFEQWLFDRQWRRLREECHARKVALIGDVPIFVAHDSADVWAHREWFRLDGAGRPVVVAGVPPDYFSATGQLWGNPIYDWDALASTRYRWWVDRIENALERFDLLRLDHFIGFERVWEIPAGAATAIEGRYVQGPRDALFEALHERFGRLPFIAEDLGVVTPEVKALRDRWGLPGIRVFQFAFGDDPCAPDFKPHNYPRHTVACTGTHDNDTTVGWFHEKGGEGSTRSPAQTERERRAALDYLGTSGREVHWEMIRALLVSVASIAIIPMQDILGLGSAARMNRPGTLSGNWEWRMAPGAASPVHATRLRHLCEIHDRTQRGNSGAAR